MNIALVKRDVCVFETEPNHGESSFLAYFPYFEKNKVGL
jgi:hypothetical protein